MSYTTGGQTIDKSMNGIITFDTGGGVVISGDTITAPVLNVTDFECDNLLVNTSSIFNGTSAFNSASTLLATHTLSANSNIPAISLTNQFTTPTTFNVVLNMNGGLNGIIQAGDTLLIARTVFDSPSTALTLAPWSNTTCGVRITKDDVTLRGLTNNFSATTTNINSTNLAVSSATTITNNVTLTGATKLTAPTITTGRINFDTAELVRALVFSSRCDFNNSASIVGNRSFEFSFGANPAVVSFEQTLLTYGAPSTTNSNVALTGTAQLSLASGTSLSLASGSSMSSAGNISLTSAANLTTSASGIFFNSAQDISIKALLSQLQFNIANTATAPRSYQFRLAALNPLLIEATTTTITNNATTTTATNALVIANSEVSPSTISVLLNAVAATANPNVTAGDDVIYANGVLNLCSASATASGIRISGTDVAINGTTTNVNSTNLTVSASTATTFVNLPSTTTTFTTATSNQFITKNIGDTLYLTNPTGGFARLSTIDNSFTNNNTFGGTTTRLSSTNNIVQSVVSGASALPPFIIRNANSTGTIDFLPNATAASLNPIVVLGDSVIASGPTGVPEALTLTANSATNVGIRIIRTGFVDIRGTTTTIISNATATTAVPSLQVRNSSNPTFELSFLNNATALAVNPIVQAGDNVIYASANSGAARNLVLTTSSLTNGGIRINGTSGQVSIPTAVTQARTENSTNVATTAYVNRANAFTDPNDIYFNVGVGGGSGTINLKRMNYDPIFAVSAILFSTQMNFNAIRLDAGVTYTGVTTYFPVSPTGAQLRIGMYEAGGNLLASTGTYTSVGVVGFHSINFTTAYTPTSNITLWIGTHVLVSTTNQQLASSTGGISATNCSPAPNATICAGRAFNITKPATFPATLNGVAKTAHNFSYWYGLY